VHGNGCNIDSLETIDERQLIPRTGFSIEPGIYLADFGIRSEIDVYMDERSVEVTTVVQDQIVPLLR
jgi:Xaa-Pro aminopeptidase